MPRSLFFALALATVSASAATAQNAYMAGPGPSSGSSYAQSQPAPIERSTSGSGYAPQAQVRNNTQVIEGVWLRSAGDVHTVSADASGTEIRVEHGRANVTVNHAAHDAQILVDLPGGQTAIVKDGLYTFNADTNTVRVLEGEAEAFPVGRGDDGITLKEEHQFTYGSGSNHARELNRDEARIDLLPDNGSEGARGAYNDGRQGYGGSFYGDGYAYGPYRPYVYPYYASPYWAGYYGYPYGYPYGYGFYGGYPYGYGLGIGLGFGYGGGYYSGYRGGYGYGGYRGGYSGFRGGYGGGGTVRSGGGGGFRPRR